MMAGIGGQGPRLVQRRRPSGAHQDPPMAAWLRRPPGGLDLRHDGAGHGAVDSGRHPLPADQGLRQHRRPRPGDLPPARASPDRASGRARRLGPPGGPPPVRAHSRTGLSEVRGAAGLRAARGQQDAHPLDQDLAQRAGRVAQEQIEKNERRAAKKAARAARRRNSSARAPEGSGNSANSGNSAQQEK